MLKTLSITLLALSVAFGADNPPPDTKLTKEAEAAIAAAEAAVQKNRAEYDKANQKALDATAKTLKAEMDKLTKAGKLEEAMAVKKEIEGFRQEVVGKVDGKALKGMNAVDLLGDDKTPIGTKISGKWNVKYDNTMVAIIEIHTNEIGILVTRISGYGQGSYTCKFDDKSKAYIGIGFDGSKNEQYFLTSNGKLGIRHYTTNNVIINGECTTIKE